MCWNRTPERGNDQEIKMLRWSCPFQGTDLLDGHQHFFKCNQRVAGVPHAAVGEVGLLQPAGGEVVGNEEIGAVFPGQGGIVPGPFVHTVEIPVSQSFCLCLVHIPEKPGGDLVPVDLDIIGPLAGKEMRPFLCK